MAKEYDTSLNTLIDKHPEEWGRLLAHQIGISATSIKTEDTKLSIESHTDKLFRVNRDPPLLIHLEMQASSRLGLPKRVWHYNTNADFRHYLPVRSIVMLLRQSSVASDINGVYERFDPTGRFIHKFEYDVLKLWEMSFEELLPFGPYPLPLCLTTKEGLEDAETTVERAKDVLRDSQLDLTIKRDIWGMLFTLGGLNHSRTILEALRMNIDEEIMEESSFVHMIEDRGIIRDRISSILRLGRTRFGEPTTNQEQILRRTRDLSRLEIMLDRLLTATNWEELLQD